jgi:hypothetical protein
MSASGAGVAACSGAGAVATGAGGGVAGAAGQGAGAAAHPQARQAQAKATGPRARPGSEGRTASSLHQRVRATLGPSMRVRLARTSVLPALLSLALCACAVPKVSMTAGPREYVPTDYPVVLKRWTREQSLIQLSEMEDKLTVTATYESWDFRWAYVVRYAADYRLTVQQRREVLDRTLRETEDDHEFYVALYGGNWRSADLSRPTSAWIVRLIDDQGTETAPSKIDLIVKPGPLEKRYFPYTTVWRHAFRIRFPKATGDGRPTIAQNARWFGLRFAGAEGNEELRWEIEQPEDRALVQQAAASP